ncbi:MAG: 50S ribosomal protein L11 methyltransferase [Candidatus Symbiothrix sp.]|jgi:ribosomal protein L11 methyltransferase|nr:50S ribosomal protein L11 methyltransferase [Candidatus Symbiothrix sp.]
MNYYKLDLAVTPNTEINRDVLSALLAGAGFESFVETGKGLDAFVPEKAFSGKAVDEALANFPLPGVHVQYGLELINGKDWNEEWEKHFFQPVIIDNQVVIHSSFHKDVPVLPYEIVIDPKMAFGTGHHSTTALMVSCLLELDLNKQSFLDMGCGTALLAILAAKKGAHPVTAVDIDRWAYENALENIRLNHTPGIQVKCGDANSLEKGSYDIIFANINRNILLNDVAVYSRRMHSGSRLFMSGFYREDREMIAEKCGEHGLEFISCKEKNNWIALQFLKY